MRLYAETMKTLLVAIQLVFLVVMPMRLVRSQGIYEVQGDEAFHVIDQGISILATDDSSLTIGQVSSPAFQERFGHVDSYQSGMHHWLRVRMLVPDSLWGEYVIGHKDMLGKTVYYMPRGKGFVRSQSGYTIPPSERRHKHIGSKSTLAILQGSDTMTLYLQLPYEPYVGMEKPRLVIRPYSTEYAYSTRAKSNILWAAVSVLFTLAVYNLLIYFFTWDRAYLLYALTFLLLTPYLFGLDRRLFDFIYISEEYFFLTKYFTFTGVFGGIAYLYFSLAYLEGNEMDAGISSRAKRIIFWLSASFVMMSMVAVTLAVWHVISIPLSLFTNSLYFLAILYLIYLSIGRVRRGSKTALYHLISTLVLVPFLTMHLFNTLVYRCDCIPDYEPLMESAIDIGIVIQALAFSLALAARISLLRKQVSTHKLEVAQIENEKLLDVQRVIEEQKQELEIQVKERTRSLREANEELKVSEDNLHQLNKTKDHFFAIISHDLRGPVASFQGISKVLKFQMKKKNMDSVEQIMDEVDASASQLNTLLDNLLQWAQTQLGGMRYNPEQTKLEPIITDIETIYANIARSKNVLTTIEIAPLTLEVWADLPATSAILRNLWGNALKFTENGTLALTATLEKEQVHIRIKDTGKGIPLEKLATIFEISENKSTIGTQGEKGNGLGLMLCKEFALKNGGDISIESEMGVGTTVHLYLPRQKTD